MELNNAFKASGTTGSTKELTTEIENHFEKRIELEKFIKKANYEWDTKKGEWSSEQRGEYLEERMDATQALAGLYVKESTFYTTLRGTGLEKGFFDQQEKVMAEVERYELQLAGGVADQPVAPARRMAL
jgi:hypothetical protein